MGTANTFLLYDTLTAKKVNLVPLKKNHISLYVCGVTVYAHCHIGHARVAVFFDTLVRVLKASGYAVTYVRNITDIDDKILSKAAQEGSSVIDIVNKYITSMTEDYDNLNLLRPDKEPLATDHMEQIITFIQELDQKGFTYKLPSGDIAFDISKFKDYGMLSKKKQQDLIIGKRVKRDDTKKNPTDFVLWKMAKPGEVSYQSPYGAGRPGWHIECSTMVNTCLGEQIDIHGGGNDLQFPHHENEIAQSQSLTKKKLASVWMHVGFLNTKDEKMSKSKGNMVSIKEALKEASAEVLRYFFLSTHYRSPINYQSFSLEQSRQRLTKIQTALQHRKNSTFTFDISDQLLQPFWDALYSDINTPKALKYMEEVASKIHALIENKNESKTEPYLQALKSMTDILGLFASEGRDLSQDVQITELLKVREKARAEKNYALSDSVRSELDSLGIVVEDGPSGTIARRKI